jgi:hypothetical protein
MDRYSFQTNPSPRIVRMPKQISRLLHNSYSRSAAAIQCSVQLVGTPSSCLGTSLYKASKDFDLQQLSLWPRKGPKLEPRILIHLKAYCMYHCDCLCCVTLERPPLWSSGQSSWLQIQRSLVRFPALPDFLRSNGSGTVSTQPREYN